jgi:hypothetical protein
MWKIKLLVMAPFIAILTGTEARALAIDVNCNGNKVGAITVNALGVGKGISGGFTSSTGNPASLAAAATACKEDHFNWYQVVTADNGKAVDASGNKLTAPYVDPPPGGYNFQWADNLPWYWDETTAPKGAKNVDPSYYLSNQVTKDTLKFFDNPTSSGNISFSTWLVSVNADGSFQGFDGGFMWDYITANKDVENLKVIAGNPPDKYFKDIIGGFATKIPEPSSMLTTITGLLGLVLLIYKRPVGANQP